MPEVSHVLMIALVVLLAPAAASAQIFQQQEGPRPQLAPEPAPEKPAPAAPAVEDEIIIIAPRRTMPDFQTVDEFYRAEFEKIRARFERAPPLEPRANEVFETGGTFQGPNDRSDLKDMVRNAPRVRDTLGGDN